MTTKKLPSLKPGCQNTSQEYGCVACGVRASDIGLPTANGHYGHLLNELSTLNLSANLKCKYKIIYVVSEKAC